MQWWATGHYTYETQHPPLSRIAVAMGPFMAGMPYHHQPGAYEERLQMEAAPDWESMLVRARAANLLFFVLACLAVWLLAAACAGAAAATVSVALFACIPVVLGHAGVATTDMALAACMPLAYWGWRWWLDEPTDWRRAAVAGMATALADLSKFSAVFFLPAALLACLAIRWRYTAQLARNWRAVAKGFVVLALAFVLVCWAAYRFEVVPVRNPPGRQFLFLDHWIGSVGGLHDFVYRLLEIPMPLTEMVKGLGELLQHTWDGHLAYLFGQVNQKGYWYFFPVVLALKAPLPFLLSAAIGLATAFRERNHRAVDYAVAAIAVTAVCLPSTLNVGVRYVLPVYVFCAPLAGIGLVWLWRRQRIAAASLCLWMAAGSAMAHSDYLGDFNLLAGRRPEHIVADSDIDWGQGLRRTTILLRKWGVGEAWLAYSGLAQPRREPGVLYHELPPNTRVSGWVAADVVRIYREGAEARSQGRPEPYGWLKNEVPVTRVGSSMFIYDLRERGNPTNGRP